MTCEEFEMAGLDLGVAGAGSPLQVAAREHLRQCPHCAALHESWQTLQEDLQVVGAETQDASTPSRVEMRLRQEFRTKHKTLKRRRVAIAAAWALAAAAVVVGAMSWVNWRQDRNGSVVAHRTNGTTPATSTSSGQGVDRAALAGPELGETLQASNDAGEFTLLPGSMPGALDDATVVRVRLQREALSSLGLTVNEERAADWIQVELLVGDDGQPQAVRLPQSTTD